LLSVRLGRPLLGKVIVLIGTVFLSSFAVQLLSFIGAFMTVMTNKKNVIHGGDGDIG